MAVSARPAQATTASIYPVHATVLSALGHGRVILNLNAVQGIRPATTSVFTLPPATELRAGAEIDGFVDARRPNRLFDVKEASAFVAGMPDSFATHVFAEGDSLPALPLVDQDGQVIHFADFRGKTTILSFVFTRCPDRTICPAISAKYLYLQQHLDPSRFHLVEVTLDPSFDSPAVLRQYGSSFNADPAMWSLVTGEAHQIKTLIDQFGISSISDAPGNYIHDDRLVIADPRGKIASILETIGWSPDDAIALAREADGQSSNPLRRFYAATIARVVALCGGGTSTGVVILDAAIFIIGVVVLGGITLWLGRLIYTERI